MADPRFPNVPVFPGVPPVLREALALVDTGVDQIRADAIPYIPPAHFVWGVFDQAGTLVLEPDNIVAFEQGAEYRIADYPTEAGGFESYNKVAVPFDIRLTMTKGGTLLDRSAFLDTLDRLQKSLDLYNVVTPERTYLSVNLARIGMQRTAASGAGMIMVDVGLREVRQSAVAAFTRTNDAAAQPTATPGQAAPARPNPPMTPRTVRRPAAARPRSTGAVQPRRPNPTYEKNVAAAGRALGLNVTVVR